MSGKTSFSRLFRGSSHGVGRRLVRDLALILLLTIGAMTAATLFLGGRLKQDLASEQIENTMGLARQEMRRLFDPVKQLLVLSSRWGRDGELGLDDPDALRRRFSPALETLPQIEGLLLAQADGKEFFLLKDADGWLTRTRQPAGGELAWTRWDAAGKPLDRWSERSDYDPRARPWYRDAVEGASDRPYWTKPYLFFTRQEPGITAALRYRSAEEPAVDQVVAVDVLLTRIAGDVERFSVMGQGKAFLVSGEGALILPPPGESDALEDEGIPLFSPARYPEGNLLLDASQRWQRAGRSREKPVNFTSDDKRWWAAFDPIYDDSDVLWLGVAVPESDLLGALSRRSTLILPVGLGVLLAGIGLAVLLAAKYRRLMKDLPKTSIDTKDYSNEIYALIRAGESPTLEFKSTLRMNLKSGKPGKEIELAWLKSVTAFLNTEGGILLIGVADDGEILGTEADGFANEDKCRLHIKNLLSQHIGLEFSPYIHIDLQPVEGRTVVAIECERAPEPAFLFAGNDESFFIRSGPASVKLGVSKVIKYLQER